MKRVTGIGGIFFKSRDPKALGEWYRRHLGLDVTEWGGAMFQPDDAPGYTLWSPFKHDTKYLEPSAREFMLNFRVDDLDALLPVLRAEGVHVLARREDGEFGTFGYCVDPEGTLIELWQPA